MMYVLGTIPLREDDGWKAPIAQVARARRGRKEPSIGRGLRIEQGCRVGVRGP